jgi:DNA-binding XRE family transcriptional regulator
MTKIFPRLVALILVPCLAGDALIPAGAATFEKQEAALAGDSVMASIGPVGADLVSARKFSSGQAQGLPLQRPLFSDQALIQPMVNALQPISVTAPSQKVRWTKEIHPVWTDYNRERMYSKKDFRTLKEYFRFGPKKSARIQKAMKAFEWPLAAVMKILPHPGMIFSNAAAIPLSIRMTYRLRLRPSLVHYAAGPRTARVDLNAFKAAGDPSTLAAYAGAEFLAHDVGLIVAANDGVRETSRLTHEVRLGRKGLLERYDSLPFELDSTLAYAEEELRAEVFRASLPRDGRHPEAMAAAVFDQWSRKSALNEADILLLAKDIVSAELNGPDQGRRLENIALEDWPPRERRLGRDLIAYFRAYAKSIHYDHGWPQRVRPGEAETRQPFSLVDVKNVMVRLGRLDRNQAWLIRQVRAAFLRRDPYQPDKSERDSLYYRLYEALEALVEDGFLTRVPRGDKNAYRVADKTHGGVAGAIRWRNMSERHIARSGLFEHHGDRSLIKELNPEAHPGLDGRAHRQAVEETLAAYIAVQNEDGEPVSAQSIYQTLHGGRTLEWLTGAEAVNTALRWCESQGLPIREEFPHRNGNGLAPKWIIDGFARDFFSLDPEDWSREDRLRWNQLGFLQQHEGLTAGAVAERIRILMRVCGLQSKDIEDMSGKDRDAVDRQMNYWLTGMTDDFDNDTLEAAVEEWAQIFGIEASWLLYGCSRAYRLEWLNNNPPPHAGRRIREYRRAAGLSRKTVATLLGIDREALWRLESLETSSPQETRALGWFPRLAVLLRVDPVRLFTGERRGVALARRTSLERFDLLLAVSGLVLKELAAKIGITHSLMKKRLKLWRRQQEVPIQFLIDLTRGLGSSPREMFAGEAILERFS